MSDVASLHRDMIDAVRKRDWTQLEALLHPDYVYSTSEGTPQRGAPAALEVAQTYTSAFADLDFEILHQSSVGNMSVVEFRATGTQSGDLPDIPATGRRIELVVCNVIEARDGKIVSEREYYDMMVMLQQLGVMDGAQAAQDHQATVARMYEAFGRGDVDAILECCSDDIAMDAETPRWGLPWYESRRGKHAMRDFFRVIGEELEFHAFEPVAMLTSDDQVAAVIRFELTVKRTGQRVRDTEIHLWTFDAEGRASAMSHVVDQHGQLLAYGDTTA